MTRRPASGRRKTARDQVQLGLALEPGCTIAPLEPVAGTPDALGAVVGSGPSSWASEVELLPARVLRTLPIPTTLVCRSHDVRWTGHVALRTARTAPVVDGLPDFIGVELDHIAFAAEHDRADLPSWCARKLAGPWVLSAGVATGQSELGERLVARGWLLGRVLRRLALRIEEVRLG